MLLSRLFAAFAAVSVLGAGLVAATPSQAAGQVHHTTTTVRTLRNGHVVRTIRTTQPAVIHHVRPLHRRVVVTRHTRHIHHR